VQAEGMALKMQTLERLDFSLVLARYGAFVARFL
jgi:hypothetical protein